MYTMYYTYLKHVLCMFRYRFSMKVGVFGKRRESGSENKVGKVMKKTKAITCICMDIWIHCSETHYFVQ